MAAVCIQSWMRQCDDDHLGCQQDDSEQRLPTRVLQILGPERIRLFVPTAGKTGQYVCLSHCWGNTSSMLRTTKATYKLHQDGILPWSSLPPTFQDAVEVTRHLGIEFLWIDSLCIIQDDAEDWRCEGSNMASIYANSSITLAASASRHSGEGLCHTLLDETFEMRRHADNMPYDIYHRKVPDHDQYIAGTMPLMKRAWFFQERALSNRIAHFGEAELYWECRAQQHCECGHLSRRRHATEPVRKIMSDKTRKDIGGGGLDNITWRDVVALYMRLQLTYESDIFPALQGIATRWQDMDSKDYVAGLWRCGLPFNLLWRSSLTGSRPNAYRAPTWSWASIVGWIDWWPDIGGTKRSLVTVLSVSTTPHGEDPLGEIIAGSIMLKGRCVPAKLVYEGENEIYRPGNCVEMTSPEDAGKTLKIGAGEWFPDVSTNVEAALKILLMPIYVAEEQKSDIVNTTIYSLALQQPSSSGGFYERVGCAGTRSPDVASALKKGGLDMEVTIV